jgi:hypothetical protein
LKITTRVVDERRSHVASLTSHAAKAPTKSVIAASDHWSAERAERCAARQASLWGVVSGATASNHFLTMSGVAVVDMDSRVGVTQ